MQLVEENNIPGLLLLFDFEKAFDSGLGDILFSPGVRPSVHLYVRLSVCNKSCPLCNLKKPLSYLHETSYKYQSTLDDVQSARTVTLAFIFV